MDVGVGSCEVSSAGRASDTLLFLAPAEASTVWVFADRNLVAEAHDCRLPPGVPTDSQLPVKGMIFLGAIRLALQYHVSNNKFTLPLSPHRSVPRFGQYS